MDREFCKKCSKCRERSVVIATIPCAIEIDHDGRKYHVKIDDLTAPRCTKCGNISHDHEASEQISRAFRKQAGLLQPEAIRQGRESLGLTPQEVAELLDVATLDFAGWESGELIQSRSHDRFLRVFFNLPELRKTLADKKALELAPVE